MERLRLDIGGMSCQHCVAAVTKALRDLPGVAVDRVEIGRAEVAYDPARTSPQAIADAVNDEGYEAVAAGA
ncbi:MAG TPA: cation transporter [Gemmatimonadaceae bacterium]|nr:cation transporter [Gemmatimonadaceae bacterium]